MNKRVEHDIYIFPTTTPPSHLSQTMTMNRGYYIDRPTWRCKSFESELLQKIRASRVKIKVNRVD